MQAHYNKGKDIPQWTIESRLLVFNIPSAICIQRDHRRKRRIGEEAICYHESWQQVRVLEEQTQLTYRILIGEP